MVAVEYLTKHEESFSKLIESMERKEVEIIERDQKTKVTDQELEQNKEPINISTLVVFFGSSLKLALYFNYIQINIFNKILF
jgi:hypothetical protein